MRARELLRGRLSRRGLALPAGAITVEVMSNAAEAASLLPHVDSLAQAAISLVHPRAGSSGLMSARVARLTEEVQKAMFLIRLKTVSVVLLIAGFLGVGAAGALLAQQGTESGSAPTTAQLKSGAPTRRNTAPAPRSGSTPAFIMQSRSLIITRLEEELGAAQRKLDRTRRTVGSPNDPEVVVARKLVEDREELMARIDALLVEAVERYPTIFDSSGRTARSPAAPDPFDTVEMIGAGRDRRQTAPNVGANSQPAKSAVATETGSYEDLDNSRDRIEWAKRMHEKGYVSKGQLDLELQKYEAQKARIKDIEADITRAQDRVDWAKKMFEKGYVTKEQYNTELLRHYTALKGLLRARGVTPELLEDYEASKARFKERSAGAGAEAQPTPESRQSRDEPVKE
jgi:hypothetical protein